MGPQMNTILLLLIFTGLVGMLLVVFFMLDRVNDIHKHSDIPQRGQLDPAAVFGGLTGKNLWDALIGVPMPGWDQKRLAAIRPRYDLVLQKHLELLFEDGKLDGREGFAMPIRCDRMVPTLRGEIESWIPHEFASGIYRAGYAIATTPAARCISAPRLLVKVSVRMLRNFAERSLKFSRAVADMNGPNTITAP